MNQKTSDIEQLSDSLIIYKEHLLALEVEFTSLKLEVDSIVNINSDLQMAKNYFSEIISSQMNWFAIIFALTFGLLGLLYWFGLIKYFQNKFKQSNDAFEDFKLLETVNHERLNDKIKTLSEKLNTSNETTKTSIEEKTNVINQNLNTLSDKIDDSIQKNSEELTSQIESQKEDFEKDKDELITKMDSINFDAQKGMFFNNYNDKDYFSAFTWAIPMLQSLIRQDEPIKGWMHNTKLCVDKMKYDESMDEKIENLNETLNDLKKNLSDSEHLKTINYISKKFNKIYYSQVDLKESKKENTESNSN